jgi:hypothetical protein
MLKECHRGHTDHGERISSPLIVANRRLINIQYEHYCTSALLPSIRGLLPFVFPAHFVTPVA